MTTAPRPELPPDARLGTQQAFRVFVERVTPRVLRWLHWMGVPPADRSDVLQEVLLVAYRRRAAFDPKRGRYEDWAYGITVRELSNFRRRARRRAGPLTSGGVDALPEAAVATPHPEKDIVMRDLLERCLGTLPREQAAMFLAHEIDGVDFRAIASAHGVSASTAHARCQDARARLQRALDALQEPQRQEGLAVLPITLDRLLTAAGRDDGVPEPMRRKVDELVDRMLAGDVAGPGLGRRVLDLVLGPRVLPALTLAIGAAGGAGLTFAILSDHGPRAEVSLDRAPPAASPAEVANDSPSEVSPPGTPDTTGDPAPPAPTRAAASASDPAAAATAEEVAYDEGRVAYARGDYEEAIAQFQRHAAQFPGGRHSVARDRLWTLALIALHRPSEARRRIEQLRRTNPRSPLLKELEAALPPEP